MSDLLRWRYGDRNDVDAAVDSTTVIEIGDLLWQDVDDAKPASMIQLESLSTLTGREHEILRQERFADQFLGVAMQRSRDGDTAPIRVAATGVFEFDCRPWICELGDLAGAIPNETGELQNQTVGLVNSSRYAIGRVAKREDIAVASVLIDIHSTVMTGGVAGSSREGA